MDVHYIARLHWVGTWCGIGHQLVDRCASKRTQRYADDVQRRNVRYTVKGIKNYYDLQFGSPMKAEIDTICRKYK